MSDYRFARRPRWIATHLLVVAVVVLFVNLGFWQLRRLDERRDRNDLVEARMAVPAAPVGEVLDEADDADELRFRAVTATGRFTGATESVRVTQGGRPGAWVFATLELDDGRTAAVLRGFVGTTPDGDLAVPAPPGGEATVEGVAIPVDRAERRARDAIESLDPALPVFVQATAADDEALTPVPVPELDDGPHLSYAVQWFLFASVVVAGYPFLLRREARRDRAA